MQWPKTPPAWPSWTRAHDWEQCEHLGLVDRSSFRAARSTDCSGGEVGVLYDSVSRQTRVSQELHERSSQRLESPQGLSQRTAVHLVVNEHMYSCRAAVLMHKPQKLGQDSRSGCADRSGRARARSARGVEDGTRHLDSALLQIIIGGDVFW